MTEKPQKYGAIAGLRKTQQPPSETPQLPSGPLLPSKPKPQGKRSDPDWKQYSVLLKKERYGPFCLRWRFMNALVGKRGELSDGDEPPLMLGLPLR